MKKFLLLSTVLGLTLIGNPLSADTSTLKIASTAEMAQSVKQYGFDFTKTFPGPFTINPTKVEKIGKYEVPELKSGGQVLNSNAVLTNFTARTKTSSAIFVKVKDEFVMIATTLMKEDGTSSRGSIIDHSNPAYSSLMNGSLYTGKVMLFGKQYIAMYDLLKDKTGKPLGAYLVALPLSE